MYRWAEHRKMDSSVRFANSEKKASILLFFLMVLRYQFCFFKAVSYAIGKQSNVEFAI